MADAWSTPGWTATNGIPLTSDIPPAIAPLDVLMNNIVSKFASIDGKHQNGFVLYTADTDLVHLTSGGVSHKPGWLVRSIDGISAGKIPATDNTTLSPAGWTYKVSVVIYGQVVMEFPAYFPYSTVDVPLVGLIDLFDPAQPDLILMVVDGGTA